MPISICYTDNELGIAASTTTNFANAIRFAANNGARVLIIHGHLIHLLHIRNQ